MIFFPFSHSFPRVALPFGISKLGFLTYVSLDSFMQSIDFDNALVNSMFCIIKKKNYDFEHYLTNCCTYSVFVLTCMMQKTSVHFLSKVRPSLFYMENVFEKCVQQPFHKVRVLISVQCTYTNVSQENTRGPYIFND